jgi:hypothetical protein
MTKPNFVAMSKSELKRYLLEHRNDTEAFYKVNAEPNQKYYTVDEADMLQELIEAKRDTKENL